jgi:hypothetical protein
MEIKSGGVLLSHAAARVVPSTLEGLTTEFGMGSGVAPAGGAALSRPIALTNAYDLSILA